MRRSEQQIKERLAPGTSESVGADVSHPSTASSLSGFLFSEANSLGTGGSPPQKNSVIDLIKGLVGIRHERSTVEIRQLERQIAFLARVFSRNYEIDVLPAPGGGWACGIDPKYTSEILDYLFGKTPSIDQVPEEAFKPKQIFYDRDELRVRDEDEILGVLRHEVGHANNTDYRLFFQGQRTAADQGYLPTSWVNIQNALEDPWVNNIEIAGSQAVRDKLTVRYSVDMPEVAEKIGTQPPTRQLGLNIIHYWLTGASIPTITDKTVLETFEKIRPMVDQYFTGKTAKENFELLRDQIWPAYRPLESKAVKDESLKEMARRLSGSDLGKPKEGGGGGESKQQGRGQGGSSSGSGILKAIKRMLGIGSQNEGAGTGQDKQDKELTEGLKGQSGSGVRRELERALADQQKQLEQLDQRLKSEGKQTGKVPDDIDLSKLPEDLREQLEDLAAQLPQELRDQLEQQARENIDQKQEEALKEDLPHGMETKQDPQSGERVMAFREPPNKKEAEQAVEQAQELAAALEQQEQAEQQEKSEEHKREERERIVREAREREEQKMRDEGFDPRERAEFEEFKGLENSMRGKIQSFMRLLEQYLPRQEHYRYEGEFYAGKQLDKRLVARRAPVSDFRVYRRRETEYTSEPRMYVKLIIDSSGSMTGEKMEESLKTVVFWGRVLSEFGIRFSVTFFGSDYGKLMSFGERYDDPAQRIKPRLLREARHDRGGTNMYDPIKEAMEEMEQERKRYPNFHGSIFVISDSGANQGHTGAPLKKLIQELQRNYTVMNFILAAGRHEVDEANEYFGAKNVIAPKNFRDLPDESFRVLRVNLERVLKRMQPGA